MVIGDILLSDALEEQYQRERKKGRKSRQGAPDLSPSEFAKFSKNEQRNYALRFARKAKERDAGWIISTTHMNKFKYSPKSFKDVNIKLASVAGINNLDMQGIAKTIRTAEDRKVRYFVSMRLEGDQSWNTDNSQIIERENSEGKKVSYRKETFSSCRQIDCRMQVFDLYMERIVFEGVSNEKSCPSRTTEEPLHRNAFIVINNGNRSGQFYPRFPSRHDMIEKCQDRFVGNFPEADD